MSQHDMNVANADGATVRADLNNALGALVTLNSGATAPSTTFAQMYWVDTTSGTLKRRNAANTGWIIIDTIDESRVVDRSSNTILDESDYGKIFRATANFTQTLTAAATLADGWWCGYRIEENITITFDPNSTENINGATTFAVSGPASGLICCNGSAFYTVGFNRFAHIVFPATQVASSDANTLDDYEEGTFTPTLQGDSTAGTQTYTSQLGRYIKIGKLVHVQIRILLSAKDGATAGNLQIAGLPFTSATSAARASLAVSSHSSFDLDVAGARYQLGAHVANAGTIADLIESGDNVAAAQLTAADFGNTSQIYCSGTYEASA